MVIEKSSNHPLNFNIKQSNILDSNTATKTANNLVNKIVMNQRVMNEYPITLNNQEIGKLCNANKYDNGFSENMLFSILHALIQSLLMNICIAGLN